MTTFSASIKLSDYEKEALRHLAAKYDQGVKTIPYDEFPRYAELGQEGVQPTIARFANYHLLEMNWRGTVCYLQIRPQVMFLLQQLDNPPPRDYWKDVETWFRGRWWSVPLVAVVVLAPILAQWGQWGWGLVQWLWPAK